MNKNSDARRTKAMARLLATAIHEAGHALADYRLGFRIKHVSITPKGDSLGHVRSTLGLSFAGLQFESLGSKTVARWHDEVVCLFAGGEAERLLGPKRLSPGGVRGDLKGVNTILERLHAENERRLVFRYLRTRAQNLVTRPINRRMIVDLADALVERRSLAGAEVLNLFRASVQEQIIKKQKAVVPFASDSSTSCPLKARQRLDGALPVDRQETAG